MYLRARVRAAEKFCDSYYAGLFLQLVGNSLNYNCVTEHIFFTLTGTVGKVTDLYTLLIYVRA